MVIGQTLGIGIQPAAAAVDLVRMTPPKTRARSITTLLIATLSVLALSVAMASASPPVLTASAPTNLEVGANLDNDLNGLALSDDLSGDTYRVSISTDLGALSISEHAGLDLATGFDSWVGLSELAFTGSVANINAALATVTLDPFDNGGSSVTVSINAQRFVPGMVYSPTNGHYYEFVPDDGITWTAARTAAATKSFAGTAGYLASIPSIEINDLVASKIPGAQNVWFGAHATNAPDSETTPQRDWHWTDGPNAGASILQCSNLEGGCDLTGGPWPLAELWSDSEPNNSSGIEDAPVTNWNGVPGRWNDLPSEYGGAIEGYVVEYGDLKFGNSASFVGTASASATMQIGAVPGQPSVPLVELAPNSNAATISWDSPAEDVSGSTVTASPGGATCSAGSSETSCSIAGLTWGTQYTFTVTSENQYGSGLASEPTASVTPYGPPTAPSNAEASEVNGAVSVSWDAPSSDGGRDLVGYTVLASPGGITCTATAPTTSCDFEGLTLGTEYSFTVVATNENSDPYASDSPASSASNEVTPITVPSAPTNTTVSTYHSTASIAWDVPSSDGGLEIEFYTVVASPGGSTCTAVAPQRACTISGLEYGVEYSFLVSASNNFGMGEDASSDPITPVVLKPGAPTGVAVAPAGPSSATISWTAPLENGGAPVTYVVTSQPGGVTCRTVTTSCVISGLSPSVAYSFVVQAFNSAGGDSLSSVVSPGLTLSSPLSAQTKLAKKRIRPSVRADQNLLKRLKPKRLSARRHYVGGTTLRIRSNKPARLSITILRASGGKWRSTNYRNPTVAVRNGLTRIKFTGRFKARALKPGRYRVSFVVTDAAGNTATPRPIDFRMLDW